MSYHLHLTGRISQPWEKSQNINASSTKPLHEMKPLREMKFVAASLPTVSPFSPSDIFLKNKKQNKQKTDFIRYRYSLILETQCFIPLQNKKKKNIFKTLIIQSNLVTVSQWKTTWVEMRWSRGEPRADVRVLDINSSGMSFVLLASFFPQPNTVPSK